MTCSVYLSATTPIQCEWALIMLMWLKNCGFFSFPKLAQNLAALQGETQNQVGTSNTLFQKKCKMDSLIFPGAQGQGPVTLRHVKCLSDMTQGHMVLTLDSRKNK